MNNPRKSCEMLKNNFHIKNEITKYSEKNMSWSEMEKTNRRNLMETKDVATNAVSFEKS